MEEVVVVDFVRTVGTFTILAIVVSHAASEKNCDCAICRVTVSVRVLTSQMNESKGASLEILRS